MAASTTVNQLLNGMKLHVAEVHRNNNQASERKGMVIGSPWGRGKVARIKDENYSTVYKTMRVTFIIL